MSTQMTAQETTVRMPVTEVKDRTKLLQEAENIVQFFLKRYLETQNNKQREVILTYTPDELNHVAFTIHQLISLVRTNGN